MNHSKLIDELLNELSYRVGIVNLKNKNHQSIISEILSEWGEYDAKQIIMEFLTNEDDTKQNGTKEKFDGYTHIGAGVYVKDSQVDNDGKAKKGAQKYKSDGKTLTAMSDDEYQKTKSAQGKDGEKAAATTPQNQQGGDVQQTEEPKTATSVSGKGGEDYKSNLPEDDPAYKKPTESDTKEDDSTKGNSAADEEKEKFNNLLDDSILELREKRRTGDAGAGGQAASYGESVYSDNVTSLDVSEFINENENEVEAEVENVKKKKLNVEQKLVLQNMGYETVPPDEEGLRYLAARKVFFNQKLKEAKSDKNHVYHKDPGFKGNAKSFESWCNAAFDGGVSTREMLKDGGEIDTTKPYKCIQSDSSVDKKVLEELQKRLDSAKTDDERKHYEREIYFFKKSGKYHDTYVVGENDNGRMTIVSVTNKAASNLKDPHNNTTPANRLSVLEGKYEKETQQVVIGAIQEGITRVTNVTNDTKKNSAEIEVDESFAKLARIAGSKYFKDIDKRGTNRKKTKAGGPARGAEFGHFLDEENISTDEWNSMSDVDKIKLVQKYNSNNDVAYDPYAKLFIKVGEVDTGGHNQLLKVRAEAEKQGIDLTASNIKEAGDIKRNEQSVVKETHENVVKTIYSSDKERGYPKTDGNGSVVENGPAARAYIDTVLDALHFTSYIDFEDKDDDKLIAQMGIRGAKPSDIRKCLSDLSGYGDVPPGTREGLKEYLRNTSTVDIETGAIVIKSKKNGQETQIAEDTWRTAGTSQKVASSFGTDMQKCVGSNVDKRRGTK